MSTQYADAMALEHANDAPVATPASNVRPAVPVEGSYVTFQDHHAYLSLPKENPPTFVMLLIHEWWGLNEQIKSMADQFAGLGGAALAVDLYQSEAAVDVPQARKLMKAALLDKEKLLQHLKDACAYLERAFPILKRGVIGWCFGEMWSLQISLHYPMDATIIFYGHLVTDASELASLHGPVLGIFGDQDKGIRMEMVKVFEVALKDAGKEHEICVYEQADHAFANPSSKLYNPKAAAAAWKKVLHFVSMFLITERSEEM
jgi:carboxymethylenebutenolidase